jgi:hypothetical protein
VRFATFNTAMSQDQAGALAEKLVNKGETSFQQIAEIIQRTRPHVLLLNEFDFDVNGLAIKRFQENYLSVSQNGQPAIAYEFVYAAPVNTGELASVDLNGDGKLSLPDDAWGFGRYPGHYGMVVLSQFPIDLEQVRTFQKFLWRDLPQAAWPVVPETNQPYYSPEQQQALRLSSKSHWDLPIKIGDRNIHFLVSHPTPPVFDGPEDRNGRRNHDEIRFWAEYIKPESNFFYDDLGRRGPLAADASFVIAGDLNADPLDGDSFQQAIDQLLKHERIQDPQPQSAGGREQSEKQAGKNAEHRGDPQLDTGDFNDRNPGNLRIDYVLPSRDLTVHAAGVYWPLASEPESGIVSASDHRLVWVEVRLQASGGRLQGADD